MITILRTAGIAFTVSLAAWAQSPQAAQPAQRASNARQTQTGTEGTIRNDRMVTMPQIGVSGAFTPNQNTLVGCVVTENGKLYLNQEELRRSYQLRGDQAQIRNNVGQLVQVSGRLAIGAPPAFNVQQVQVIQPKCNYAQTSFSLPATGGTGSEGAAFNVTSTATVGQATPGYETEPGVKQNPSMAEGVSNFGAYANARPGYSESQGAPPDPRIENPAEAERIANAATRAELNNQSQLGVNAQPNYGAESNPQQTQQVASNDAQQQRGQAVGSTQVFRGAGEPGNQITNAEEQGEAANAPVFTGCIEQRNNQLVLVESATNQTFRVNAHGHDMASFLNRQVRIVGNYTGIYGPAIGTAGNSATVQVLSVSAVGTCNPR